MFRNEVVSVSSGIVQGFVFSSPPPRVRADGELVLIPLFFFDHLATTALMSGALQQGSHYVWLQIGQVPGPVLRNGT